MSEVLIKAPEAARRIGVSLVVVQRIIAVLLMVVFVGCGEDEPEKVKLKEDEGPVKRIIWAKDGSRMALIPAGSFEMGDYFDEGRERRTPCA